MILKYNNNNEFITQDIESLGDFYFMKNIMRYLSNRDKLYMKIMECK